MLTRDHVIKLVEHHELTTHAYADDLQICGHSTLAQSSELTSCIEECINQVQAWMASNRLRLNHTETEFIWLGTARRRQQLASDKVSLSYSRPSVFVTLVWRSTVICQWLHTSAISLVYAFFTYASSGFCGAHSPLMQHTV